MPARLRLGMRTDPGREKKNFVVSCLFVCLFVCMFVCLFVCLFSLHIVPEFRRKLFGDCSDCSGDWLVS